MRLPAMMMVVAAMTAAFPAFAQEGPNAPCVNQANGAYDAVASQNWQDHFRNSDRQAIQMISGTWYSELPNRQLGMIAYTYESYLPTQIFDYRQKTCGSIGTCSDSYGTGMYGAETQADGSLFITRNFSDNNRRNACGGFYVRFLDPNTMMNQGGLRLRRVQ
jgi:hypothetical protein